MTRTSGRGQTCKAAIFHQKRLEGTSSISLSLDTQAQHSIKLNVIPSKLVLISTVVLCWARITGRMGDHLQAGEPSRYVASHLTVALYWHSCWFFMVAFNKLY